MTSPAYAIAWELSRQHRWGFVAVAGYLVVLTSLKVLTIVSGGPILSGSEAHFAVLLMVPLSATIMYLLALFSFGFSGDLAARPSIYPTRMFTLPVTSAALAGWPMLYGAVSVAILWAVTRLVAPWPPGVPIPVIWPGLLAVVVLAWTQALTWMPYGLPGFRVIAALLWLSSVNVVVVSALELDAGEPVMLAILAPQVLLAYLAAQFAVARARRGVVPDWRGPFLRLGRLADPRGARDRFDSPEQAQAWLEWRQHGRALPVLVGLVLPFELALLFTAGDAPVLVFVILLGVLLTAPFMAGFAAATVRKASPGSDGYGVTPFLATRALSSAALITAKLKMAARSTLAAWLLVVVAVPVALAVSDTASIATEWVRDVVERAGALRAVVLALLISAALLTSTWKQLVQSLYVGLSGREWAVKTSVFLSLAALVAVGPFLIWIIEEHIVIIRLLHALPWILAVLAGLKLCAAAWVAVRLYDSRLVSDRTLVAGAACWLVAVLALHSLLVWLVDTPFVRSYVLLLVAVLVTPLARISAAPLTLAWNRHR